MKTPISNPTTRESLVATAAYNTRWFASLVAGTTVLGSSALAVDNDWTGAVDNNWNNGENWSDPHSFGSNHVPQKDGGHPGDEDARINTLTNFPVITTATGTLPIPRDIKVGMGGGPGRLDIRSGSAATGGGNWMFVGAGGGGNGTFNLADTSAVGAGISGFALGSGGVTSERLYVGGIFGNGTGVVNTNTTGTHRVFNRVYVGANAGSTGTVNLEAGTMIIGNDLALGSGGGTGDFNMTAGTVTCGGWNFYGKDEDGANGTGNFNMSGGSFTNTGRQYVGSGNTKGTFALSGGTYQNSNDFFSVGSGNLSNAAVSTLAVTGGTLNAGRMAIGGEADNNAADGKGAATVGGTATINTTELWIGQGGDSVGTFTMSGGLITTNGWVAVGREGADGTLTLSGGTFAKTGGGDFIVGSDASGSVGVINQTGGTISVNSALNIGTAGGSSGTWIMDSGIATVGGTLYVADNGTGTVTLNDGTVTVSGGVRVGQNGGSTATFALNGGTLTTSKISGGGGSDTTTFNGTQIVVGIPANPFIEGLDSATIGTNGLKVDTNGAVATSTQAFVGSGPVTKTGAGTLNLNGASTNTGTYGVVAGKLGIGTEATGTGAVTVSNGAGFGVNQTVVDQVLTVPSVTMGTSTSLDVNLGNLGGITANAPLNVTTLNTAGNVVINVADAAPEPGMVPLISYGTKTGSGTFVLGTLPLGVVATLDLSVPNLVRLNVTSVALPFWDGTVNNVWDTSTQNWINLIGNAQTAFANGNPALFDDFADGSVTNPAGFTDVVLNSTVLPATVTFENSSLAYTLTGTGSIGGTGGLLKTGTGTLLLGTANTYTGVTRLEGGVTTINSVADAGSSIGSGSSNLVFAGGSLEYDGTAAGSTTRAVTIDAQTTILTQDDLTLGGQVTSLSGNLTKTGLANLTLSNVSNQIGVTGQINRVDGTLTVNAAGGTTSVPGELWIGSNPGIAGHLLVDGGSLNVGSWLTVGRGNGESGTLSTLTGINASIQCTNFSVGYNNNLPNDADQTVTLSNTVFTNNGATKLAESEQSTTSMTIGGTSSFTSAAEFLMALGENSICNVTVQDSGSLTKTGGWMSIGNSSNGVGTMTVKDNGTMTAGGDLNVADVDTSKGTLNVQGNGLVVSTGAGNQGLLVGKNANTEGTVNLDGGTIEAMRVRGGAGTSTFNFNGGVLKARTGADGTFMDLINSAVVLPGGATINSNGQTIAIPQSLQDGGGGLTKIGAGTLLLNGGNTYTGTTTVSVGTLGGTGNVEGPLVVSPGAFVAPGANGVGTFVAGATTISGKYVCEINGASGDQLAVIGSLNVSAGTLDIDAVSPPTAPAYVIATYTGATPAPFLSVLDLPPNYSVNYAYNDGLTSTNVAIVRPLTAYETWAGTFGLDPLGNGAANVDNDGDGQSNGIEFALGGSPISGSDNAKVFHLAADSSDGGSAKELLMTIAVRSGTPAFSPLTDGQPTATHDGVTYTIQGSTNLSAFDGTVAVVTTVNPPAPNAAPPAGYVYRTFSLEDSDGLPGKGFLRVSVTP